MAGSFLFVDGVNADKRARSHVMKGKNAGRRIYRRSRLTGQYARPTAAAQGGGVAKYTAGDTQNVLQPCPRRDAWLFSLPSTPWDIPVEALHIVDKFFTLTAERMYNLPAEVSNDRAKQMYFQYIFTDEATFNTNVALMQVGNEIFLNEGTSSRKALQYLAQTFRYVQARLKGESALSDSTLMMILALVQQELLRDYQDAAMVHFGGVQRIVQLRGGLDCLMDSPVLVLKVCKIDIMMSLQDGNAPQFLSEGATVLDAVLRGDASSHAFATPSRLGDTSSEYALQGILEDAQHMCAGFDDCTTPVKLDAFRMTAISLCYRLLAVCSVEDTDSLSTDQAMLHVGLLTFLLSTWVTPGHRRILRFDALHAALKTVLEADSLHCDPQRAIWLLMIAGIWVSPAVKEQHVIPALSRYVDGLNNESWSRIRTIISGLPWINFMHDNHGRTLWQQVVGRD